MLGSFYSTRRSDWSTHQSYTYQCILIHQPLYRYMCVYYTLYSSRDIHIPCSCHAALLRDVVAMTPQVALESLPRLREAFSYLSVLPPSSAIDLLSAVLVSRQCTHLYIISVPPPSHSLTSHSSSSVLR